MSNSVMRDKAKAFAKNMVFLCRNIKAEHKETVLINQLHVQALPLVRIFTKHNMHKVQKTLCLNLKLLKRNAMKQNIGLSFYLKPIVLKNVLTSLFRMIAEQFAEC